MFNNHLNLFIFYLIYILLIINSPVTNAQIPSITIPRPTALPTTVREFETYIDPRFYVYLLSNKTAPGTEVRFF